MIEIFLANKTIFLTSFFSFIFGIIFAKTLLKQKNNDKLSYLLEDLKSEIKNLSKQNDSNIHDVKYAINEASKLAKALTTNQNLKGQFGEDCLEVIIKNCFPNKNLNYIKQFETLNEDDKKIKPDYVINLPNDKNLVIDCKLNLEKFIEFQECENEYKAIKKAELIKDLNSTINNLHSKKYESAKNLNQLDFILMYIPLETLITHIYTDSDFLGVVKNANEKNIIIVGNSSILTTIRLINSLWAYHNQDKNIENIVNIAQNIYSLIAQHSKNLSEIKNSMEKIYSSFNKEFDLMKSESKLFCAVEKLREYGINAQNKKVGKKLNEIEIEKGFLN